MNEEEEDININLSKNSRLMIYFSLIVVAVALIGFIGYVLGSADTCQSINGFYTSSMECRATQYKIENVQDCVAAYGIKSEPNAWFQFTGI